MSEHLPSPGHFLEAALRRQEHRRRSPRRTFWRDTAAGVALGIVIFVVVYFFAGETIFAWWLR